MFKKYEGLDEFVYASKFEIDSQKNPKTNTIKIENYNFKISKKLIHNKKHFTIKTSSPGSFTGKFPKIPNN